MFAVLSWAIEISTNLMEHGRCSRHTKPIECAHRCGCRFCKHVSITRRQTIPTRRQRNGGPRGRESERARDNERGLKCQVEEREYWLPDESTRKEGSPFAPLPPPLPSPVTVPLMFLNVMLVALTPMFFTTDPCVSYTQSIVSAKYTPINVMSSKRMFETVALPARNMHGGPFNRSVKVSIKAAKDAPCGWWLKLVTMA